jgi:CoA:oxalate CoA-transferase
MTTLRPLSGIRVVEVAQLVAGPYCSTLLGMLGADVIKIEPLAGDFARAFGPFVDGRSVFYESVNPGKTVERLDLRGNAGRERLAHHLSQADVVVHNMTPGAATRLGLNQPELGQRYPDLILCAVSAFGNHGAEANRTGVDLLFQAESGLMAVTGAADGPATRAGTNVPDVYTAVLAALGVVAALYERDQQGITAEVNVSLLAATVAMQTCWYAMVGAGETPLRLGNESPFTMPTGTFATREGDIVISIVSDPQWFELCDVLGITEEVGLRFPSNEARQHSRDEVRLIVETALAPRTAQEWLPLLTARRLPAGLVRTHREVVSARPELFDDYDGIPVPRFPIDLRASEAIAHVPGAKP